MVVCGAAAGKREGSAPPGASGRRPGLAFPPAGASAGRAAAYSSALRRASGDWGESRPGATSNTVRAPVSPADLIRQAARA